MSESKNTLSIRLTEPVVFLRSSDPSGRHQADPSDPPALVRGLLTLNVVKPTRISSIEVELEGVATTSWPEAVMSIRCRDGRSWYRCNVIANLGVGPRRVEITEDIKIYSAATAFFRADQSPCMRRTASVGPGLSLVNVNYHGDCAVTISSRTRSPSRGRSPERRNVTGVSPSGPPLANTNPGRAARHVSCDNASFARMGVDIGTGADLGPTPPYTPSSTLVMQPRPRLSHLHTGSSGSGSAAGESPAQTLEELRQALRDNLEGQGHSYGQVLNCSSWPPSAASAPSSARPHTASFSLPTPPRTRSCASSISNVSLHRENDPGYDRIHPHLDDTTLSRHSSTEEEYPQTQLSPLRGLSNHTSLGRTSRTCSPDVRRTPDTSLDASHTRTGRAYSRFSLGSVLGAVKEVATGGRYRSRGFSADGEEERGRGRTRVRVGVEDGEGVGSINAHGRDGIVTGGGNSITPGTHTFQPSGHRDHPHHLLSLGRALGLDWDHDKEKVHERQSKEQGEGWKEFKKGTYTYPISFLLPPDLPPTLVRPYGTLTYTLKGVVHRPGTFTSKLSCQAPVLVVAAPSIGAGEGGGAGDPGPVIVERQWEGYLAYVVGLRGRVFVIGSQHSLDADRRQHRVDSDSQADVAVEASAEATHGTVTLDLTLMPLDKVKVWRLSIYIDEQVSYLARAGRIARDDGIKRVMLLDVQDACLAEDMSLTEEKEKHKNKHKGKDATQIVLLPTPISPHRSPLLRYLPASVDPSILAGPGPYTLTATVGLPGCDDESKGGKLHFTVKQKGSNVRVDHTLRIMMRVERVGDEGGNEQEKGEKKKLFDIAVQTPVTILSCRCTPDYQALPRYSQTVQDSSQHQTACPCTASNSAPSGEGHKHDLDRVASSDSVTTSFEIGGGTGSGYEACDHVHNGQNERSESSSRTRTRTRAQSNSGKPSILPRPHLSLHAHAQLPQQREAARSPSHSRPQTSLFPQQNSGRGPHDHQPRSHSESLSISQLHSHSQMPSPHTSRPPSPPVQYERLVSGLESEAGEAPPSYESVAGSEATNEY
ncbi:hypothetical protein BS17DRAFT_763711 [Gyrodon lividus]|nr:hypothetical protein BS17DRAFT_763711 [Gyrodon lividus]